MSIECFDAEIWKDSKSGVDWKIFGWIKDLL